MAQLINIGNSKGVRLPKSLIEQAHLDNKELEFIVLPEGVLIHPIQKNRQGWKEQFSDLAKHPLTADEKEWLEASIDSSELEEDWSW